MADQKLDYRRIWNVLHSFETKRLTKAEALQALQLLGLGVIRSKYLINRTETEGYSPTRYFSPR